MTFRFAWPQFHKALQLNLEFTDPEVPAGCIDSEQRRVRLDSIGTWETAEMSMQLTSTEVPTAGIGDLHAYVLISSARTNTRVPVRLDRVDDVAFAGKFRLDRGVLSGAVHVIGQVVAFGDWGVRTVGGSHEWMLVVDASAAPIPPGAPPFEIVWVDFSESDAPAQLKGVAHTSYALMDTAGPKPVLYINKGVDGLDSILGASKPRDERKRLRNVLGAQIAHYAATTLFDEAIRRCDMTNGDIALPDDVLLTQLITAVTDEIDSFNTADDLVAALLSDGVDHDEARAKVDDALSVLTNLSSHVLESVKAVAHG